MENENKKMPFHLTITDNETGEAECSLDFDCLIGAVHIAEGEARGLLIQRCNNLTKASTVCATEDTLHEIHKKDPLLILAKMAVTSKVVGETEETENEE